MIIALDVILLAEVVDLRGLQKIATCLDPGKMFQLCFGKKRFKYQTDVFQIFPACTFAVNDAHHRLYDSAPVSQFVDRIHDRAA
jgi:hypothetical protein